MSESADADAAYDVLMVEDNPGDVRLAREAFAEFDREVRAVADGERALELLGEYGEDPARLPRLVLLDLDLPELTGLDLLRRIDERGGLEVPVVVFTNSRATADVRAAYEAEANAYLVKPDDFEGFAEMIESVERFWLRAATVPDSA